MKEINSDKHFTKELIRLIKDSSNIRILGININWLNNYRYVSIIITILLGTIVGLIIGLIFNNIEKGLIAGLIIETVFGIYIGSKINKNYTKKR